MKAVAMKCYIELAMALPNCKITEPKERIQYILDANNEKVGEILWSGFDPVIGIYSDYEYAKEVRESLGKEHFYDVENVCHWTPEQADADIEPKATGRN